MPAALLEPNFFFSSGLRDGDFLNLALVQYSRTSGVTYPLFDVDFLFCVPSLALLAPFPADITPIL